MIHYYRSELSSRRTLLKGSSALALALLVGVGATAPALAQAADSDAAAPATVATDTPADPGGESTVTVTASRIARAGFTAPTPTTVVGIADLQNQGATNIADMLNTLPAFGSGTNPTSTNHTSANSGANLLDLRNLGENRTLVLVDGHRFVPATVQGRIDLNVIPTVLIDHTEVVTGGASAAWGSDAVAGVVNLVFKKKMTGLQGETQFGISNYGDGKKYRAALSWGTDFGGGRGNFMIAGEWEDSKGIGPGSSRPILAKSQWNAIQNPNYKLGNGQPRTLLVDGVNVSTATLGGMIATTTTGSTTTQCTTAQTSPLCGTQFLPGGVPTPFVYGSLVGTQYMVGGSPIGGIDTNQLGQLQDPLNRVNIYARSSYDFSDAFSLFGEASYARSLTDNFYLSIPYDLGTISIKSGNPFIPTSIQQVMTAKNISSIGLGRINADISYNMPKTSNRTQRYMVGAEGRVLGNWKYSAYFQFGQDKYIEEVAGNRNTAAWSRALDAVLSPNGQIVCRSTLTNPGDGCIPINLFGEGTPSAAASAYVTGTSWQHATFKQQSGAANMSGTPFSLWAGDVALAFGGEWRHESVSQTVDALSAVSGWNIHNPKALAGAYTIKEGYAEVDVPLLKDVPLVQNFDINAAVRYTDYSTSGGVTSWKVGGTWEVTDFLRLRATKSRDIRAPALGELFASQIVQSGNVTDPQLGNIQYATLAPQTGNANLKPEIGDTWTVGAVLKPFRAFNISVDYYNIQVKDAIGLPALQDIVDGCYNLNVQTFCSLITRGVGNQTGTNRIGQVIRQYVNQGSLTVRGIDIEASYATRLNDWFGVFNGSVTTRVLASYLNKYENVYNGKITESAGRADNPRWRVNATFSYDQGPYSFYLEGRYIGGGHYTNDRDAAGVYLTARPDGTNDIAPQFLLATTVQYVLKDFGNGRRVQLFGTVRNLTNNIQNGNPFAYILTTTGDQGVYDIIGRTYTGGVRFKF